MLCYVAKIDLTVLICVFVVACIEETLFNVEVFNVLLSSQTLGIMQRNSPPATLGNAPHFSQQRSSEWKNQTEDALWR